jgi:hypothetical protein
MNNVVSRHGRIALGGALLALMLSGGIAAAQYYPPSRYGSDPGYPPGYVPYGRGYDRPFNRNFDSDQYLRRRPPVAGDDAPAQPRRVKRFEEPKEDAAAKPNEAGEKSLKGPYQIVVSINAQHVSLYGANGLIRTSPVSTGMRGHPTPTGVFTVIGKERFHRSNIYSNAPMPFMQRITWSGVALHEGVLPGYPASHGCIRMGGDFAVFMWTTTKVGSRVIVTNEAPAPADISSAKLFVPLSSSPRVATPAVIAADGKLAASTAKGAVRVADEPSLLVMQNNGPDAAAQTAFAKPKIDAYRDGPVSVFVSRKTGKLYVRYDYAPLFETAVTIKNPSLPLGTHVYTAMERTNDGAGMRCNAISIPNPAAEPVALRPGKKGERQTAALNETDAPELREAQTAAAALDRIEMPKEAVERIANLLTVGSSLTVSDYGISEETGLETDFIILTK